VVLCLYGADTVPVEENVHRLENRLMMHAVKAGSLVLLATALFCPPQAMAEYDPWGFGIDARVAFGKEESRDRTPLYREGDGALLGLALNLPVTGALSARLSGERLELSGDRAVSLGGFNPVYDDTRQLAHAELILHRPRQSGLHPYLSAGLIRQEQKLVLREQDIDGGTGEIVTRRIWANNDLDGFSLGTGLVWSGNQQEYTLALEQRSLETDNGRDSSERIIRISAARHLGKQLAIGLDLEQRRYDGITHDEEIELLSLGLQARWRF
jgi:hypothetical protein